MFSLSLYLLKRKVDHLIFDDNVMVNTSTIKGYLNIKKILFDDLLNSEKTYDEKYFETILIFYYDMEKLTLNLFIEMFRKSFFDNVTDKKCFFIFLDKILKLCHLFDTSEDRIVAFCEYTKIKGNSRDPFDVFKRKKIEILGTMTYPIGRLILTYFYDSKVNLF